MHGERLKTSSAKFKTIVLEFSLKHLVSFCYDKLKENKYTVRGFKISLETFKNINRYKNNEKRDNNGKMGVYFINTLQRNSFYVIFAFQFYLTGLISD